MIGSKGLLKHIKAIVDTQISKKVYPKNPLGIIALFVFLIEAISTVSLKFLLDSQSHFVGYIVAFIISFPVIIIILFFITLWVRRESLYSPADFRDDASFVQLFAKKIERLEAKQQATQVDPRDDATQALPIIQNLLNLNEIQTAINLGKAFLKVERYSNAQEIFELMLDKVPATHESHPKILSQLAYSLMGQRQYAEAIKMLQKARRESQTGDLSFWPSLGLAYSYLKSGQNQDADRWIVHAKSLYRDADHSLLVAKLYPELKSMFQPVALPKKIEGEISNG
jgi:tetratricopeptide (TPR) repeat protein